MNLRRTGSALLVIGALSLSATACGSDDSNDMKAEPKASASDTMNAGAQTFGPGCAGVPKTGAGSFNGMATAPVATAASANPLLKTLVAAVGAADLGDTLNSADGITVFAPTDDAFAKIPKKTLDGVLADKATLTKILTHHVVAGQLSPDELAGTHKTLEGDSITVKGSGENFTVGKENAAVLCGNIPTANATVYVIDTVLMP
ncbi:fasciclin domain-containing protein [Nocardioides jiangxiensis]|uniref:Fasciclin domain-containing protein n=1 Tax=Nocardioides jiangxiensis TaxID=3064524 RepID=A0ABT9AZM1_9ACTN|nr:fasciclin domain-containing protein [Nocardioides sp. WY-20]MDO7868040.1 fasciclin domain-containing protein [Nocardioides sp. WY-20]